MRPRERDALLLYALANLSYQEIAVALDVPWGRYGRGFTGRAGLRSASSRRRQTVSISRHQELICVDELDLFRNFRRGAPAPSEDAQLRASALLSRAVDREQTAERRILGPIGKRARFGALVLALAGATATALFISTPWSNSPSFLEKAQAALTPPAGMILHEKWEETTTSTDPACTVEHGPSEIWIDETPPYRYRLLVNDFPPEPAVGPALACAHGTAAELGGTLGDLPTLRFVLPNTLSALPFRYSRQRDPVTWLRQAISAGAAHDEGKTQLDGRAVELIRIDPPSDCRFPPCPREPGYAYVDPRTFHPVRTEGPGFIAEVGGSVVVRLRIVEHILTFEYLPRTGANLALTDIRAQHPNATGP